MKKAFTAQRAANKAAEVEELATRRAALEKKTQACLAAEQARKIREAQEDEEEERTLKAQTDITANPIGCLEPLPLEALLEDHEDDVPRRRKKRRTTAMPR